jgi:hypothetical protein
MQSYLRSQSKICKYIIYHGFILFDTGYCFLFCDFVDFFIRQISRNFYVFSESEDQNSLNLARNSGLIPLDFVFCAITAMVIKISLLCFKLPTFFPDLLGDTVEPHKTKCWLPSPDLQSFLFRWLARERRSPPMLAAWFWSRSEDSMTSLSFSSTLTRCTPPSSR